jgi:predicted nucleic acid-binding protein
MNELVIDASVAVKWYTREEHREKALRLREAHINGELTLTAPSLLAYEVINALRFNPSLTPGDLEDAVAALFLLGIELEPPTRESMAEATRIADRYGTTIYDAAYLSLAIHKNAALVTSDKRLAEKSRETGRVKELASVSDQQG